MEEASRNGILLVAADDGPNMNVVGVAMENLIYPLEDMENEPEDRELRTRNKQFFEITIPLYTDELFKEHFRMSREAFQVIYSNQ